MNDTIERLEDISARLNELESAFDAIYWQTHHLIGSAKDWFFTDLNKSWELATGYTIAELKSRPFITFVHPSHASETTKEYQQILSGVRGADGFKNEYVKKDGSSVCLEWHTTKINRHGVVYFRATIVEEGK